MGESWEQYGHRIMSGEALGLAAVALRGICGAAEPFYAGAMSVRNRLYDAGAFASHSLGRPTLNVGNITAGGTGKTPVVRWLAERLIAEHHRPAILLRGYKSSAPGQSDEQQLLDRHLNAAGGERRAIVYASPSRIDGARFVLADHPEVTLFILDDAFQHRKAARNLDIVLINAVSPFGYDHVHPRGLLREPLRGLSRAGAIVLTHVGEIAADRRAEIERQIRRHHPSVTIYRANHVQTGLRTASRDASLPPDVPLDDLSRRRFFAASGIGSPRSLQRQLARFDGTFAGHQWFDDHHHYTAADLASVRGQARSAGAEAIVVTEKDWVKLQPLNSADEDRQLPILRLDVEIRFENDEGERLLEQVKSVLTATAGRPAGSSRLTAAVTAETSPRARASR